MDTGKRTIWRLALLLCIVLLACATSGWAQETASSASSVISPVPAAIGAGDTAWVLVSTALVLLLIVPGLALFLFYGGLVRSKNVLGTIVHSFVILSLLSPLWILIRVHHLEGQVRVDDLLDVVGIHGVGGVVGMLATGLVPARRSMQAAAMVFSSGIPCCSASRSWPFSRSPSFRCLEPTSF
jgi:hypothetical protein